MGLASALRLIGVVVVAANLFAGGIVFAAHGERAPALARGDREDKARGDREDKPPKPGKGCGDKNHGHEREHECGGDTTAPAAPTQALAENPASPNQHVAGTTLYYRPGGPGGTFRVSSSASDPESGIASVTFLTIAGLGGGGVSDLLTPYEHDYSWSDATGTAGAQKVATATNTAGLTGPAGTITLAPDGTAPSGHALALAAPPPSGYYTSASVPLAASDGADAGSGLDPASRVYERDEAPLTGGKCGAFPGTFATTVANPDETVVSGGCYRYRLKISDNVGNQSAPSAPTAEARIDTAAPTTAIGSGPSGTVNRSSASFTFASSEPGSTFSCSLDDGDFGACSSPQDYSGLADGSHTFQVRATDAAGNIDPTAAARSWTIDTRPPPTGYEPKTPASAEPAVTTTSNDVNAVALPKPSKLVSPKGGAHVTSPPVLRWVSVAKATYYNVQLFRGRRKVLSAWPSRAPLRLASDWVYKGRRYRLTPGRYRWYVWPGFGARSAVRYGDLLGGSAFVVVPEAVVDKASSSSAGSVAAQTPAAPGAAPAGKLVLEVSAHPRYASEHQSSIPVRIEVSLPVELVATLESPAGGRLFVWESVLRAGTTIVRLKMPELLTRPGGYTLVLRADAGGQQVARRLRIVLVPARFVQRAAADEGSSSRVESVAAQTPAAPGAAPAGKLVLDVSAPPRYAPERQSSIPVRIEVSLPVELVATLESPGGARLFAWKRTLRAGATIVRLKMPELLTRPGDYTLVLRAGAGGQQVARRLRIVLVRARGIDLGRLVRPSQKPTEVVLVNGSDIRKELALDLKSRFRVASSAGVGVFEIASRSDGRRAVVIDVDEAGVGLVRDLHLVFPDLRILALSSSAARLAEAGRAGASAVLRKPVSPKRIAGEIRRLLQSR